MAINALRKFVSSSAVEMQTPEMREKAHIEKVGKVCQKLISKALESNKEIFSNPAASKKALEELKQKLNVELLGTSSVLADKVTEVCIQSFPKNKEGDALPSTFTNAPHITDLIQGVIKDRSIGDVVNYLKPSLGAPFHVTPGGDARSIDSGLSKEPGYHLANQNYEYEELAPE